MPLPIKAIAEWMASKCYQSPVIAVRKIENGLGA